MRNLHKARISWEGILAGLVVGLVSLLAAMSLGTVLTALTGFDLYGTGIMAVVWTILSIIASSYVAGMVAMLVNKPYSEILEVDVDDNEIETSIHKYRKNAKITGLVTGSLIVLLSTYATASGLSNLISNGAKVIGSTAATTTAGAVYGGSQMDLNSLMNDISREDVEALVARSSDDLNRSQINATADVILNIYRNSRADFENTSLDKLPETLKSRYAYIKDAMTGQEFLNRLQAQGLTEAQAREVQGVGQEYIKNTEETIDDTILAAKKATIATALLYLLSIGLILGFTTLGACSVKHTEEEIDKEKINTKKNKNKKK